MGDEHGDFRAVFALVEDLLDLELVGIEIHLGLLVEGALTALEIVAVDRAGRGEVGKAVEGLGGVAATSKAAGGSDTGQLKSLNHFTL